jgi:chromosome segregation ATPase
MNPDTNNPCPVRHRIEELRSCPAYETHIEELEALALKVLGDGEEQISMLTEALEDTEQVRDSWCEAYTEARDDLEATLNENQKLRELLEEWLRACAPDRLNRLATAPEEPVTKKPL